MANNPDHLYEAPDDVRYAQWIDQYGTTGVKRHRLEGHPANKNCIAVYRETTMQERSMLARLEKLEESLPDSESSPFSKMRMLVSSCLLHPNLDEYPRPVFATRELFGRIRQHGHGPLTKDEEQVGAVEKEDGSEEGGLPKHIAQDIKTAREVAEKSFDSPRVGSFYKDLIMSLATRGDGSLDPQVFDYLWQQPPGRIREIAARTERAHMQLRAEQWERLEEEDLEPEQRKAQSKQIDALYPSPFASVDELSKGATAPESTKEEAEEEERDPTEDIPDEELPPNAPTKEETTEALRKAKKEPKSNSKSSSSGPVPPNAPSN